MPHLTFSAFFGEILGRSRRVSRANWFKPWFCLGMAGFLWVRGLAFGSSGSGGVPEAIGAYLPRHIIIDAETTAKGPVEINLGEMGSAQRIYFTVEIKPVADDEILEEVQVTCSCVGLETEGRSHVLADSPVFTGRFDVPWANRHPEATSQTLTIKTNLRTVPILLSATSLPSGTPKLKTLGEVNVSYQQLPASGLKVGPDRWAASRLHWEHPFPADAEILRIECDSRWAEMGLGVQPSIGCRAIVVTLDQPTASAWFVKNVKEYPRVEQVMCRILYKTQSDLLPYAAENIQIFLSHLGYITHFPKKLDFGVLRGGEKVTRRLKFTVAENALIDFNSPDAIEVKRLAVLPQKPTVISFDISLNSSALPACSRPGFAESVLYVSLANGTVQRIPFYFVVPKNHEKIQHKN